MGKKELLTPRRKGAKECGQGSRMCWLITRLMPSSKVSMPKFISRPSGRFVRRR